MFPCFFDIASYILGSIYGKRKFFLKITPKKTWEGILGGVLCIAIMNGGLNTYLNGIFFISYQLIIVILIYSIIGDLVESIFKRLSSKKDSGNILPGHGGMLDRLDSVLPVISITYAIYLYDINYKYFYI